MSRRHANVVNADEVEARQLQRGRHQMRLRAVGRAAGGRNLGATLTELPPGALSFPCHAHCGNEEAIYVLSGSGTARIGDERVPVRAGDWIALPAGLDFAHQMINDGAETLAYLCVSTLSPNDVVYYPDSNKVNVAGADPTQPRGVRLFGIFRREDGMDFGHYWDREPEAQ